MGGYGDGWWVLMWAWMAAFWLLVIVGAAWLIWRAAPRQDAAPGEVLKQRLARGDIDLDEYRALVQALGSGTGSPRTRDNAQIVLAALAALAVIILIAAPAIVAARGGWDMFDHMGWMMGGGRDTSSAPLTTGGTAEIVTIQDFAFSPGNLQVPAGAAVTWTNRDSTPHDATSRDGSWKTGTLSKGESETLTFDRAGDYDYYCSIHPSMKARLVVR